MIIFVHDQLITMYNVHALNILNQIDLIIIPRTAIKS